LSLLSFSYSLAYDEIEIEQVVTAPVALSSAINEPSSAAEQDVPSPPLLIDILLSELEDLLAQRRVLALDGGGIRGAFTAEILKSIEKETNKPIYKLFQGGITGTSTGSFIALGLTTPHKATLMNTGPYTSEEIVNFYITRAEHMFPGCCAFDKGILRCPSSAGSKVGCFLKNAFSCFGCFGCFHNCGGLCGPKYRRGPLDKELALLLGNTKLAEALIPVQTTTYDIGKGGGVLHLSSIDPSTNHYLMSAAAAASSAAPTYFPAAEIGTEGSTSHRICIDGGLVENTPILPAIAQAMALSKEDLDVTDLTVVSIGTGQAAGAFNDSNLKHAGALSWARPAIKIGMEGTSAAVDMTFRNIYKRGNYIRIQCALNNDLLEMDEPRNILGLIKEADKLYKDTTSSLHTLIARIRAEEKFIRDLQKVYGSLRNEEFEQVLRKFSALVGTTIEETKKNLLELSQQHLAHPSPFSFQVITYFQDVRLLKILKTIIFKTFRNVAQ